MGKRKATDIRALELERGCVIAKSERDLHAMAMSILFDCSDTRLTVIPNSFR